MLPALLLVALALPPLNAYLEGLARKAKHEIANRQSIQKVE